MSAKPIKFTVALIAKNEENNIIELGNNLSKYIDKGLEVVLIDTGSTDNTVNIAKFNKFNVYTPSDLSLLNVNLTNFEKEFIDKHVIKENELDILKQTNIDYTKYFNFSVARNMILEANITNDMILFIDASDRIINLNYEIISKLIDAGMSRFEYYLYAGGQKLKISRFYHKKIDKWVCRVHEVLSVNTPREKNFNLKEDLLKIEHTYKPKVRNYIGGLMIDYINNMNNSRHIYYLGREFFFLKMYNTSINILKQYLELGVNEGWLVERSSASVIIGDCYLNLNDRKEAYKFYLNAFNIYQGWREPLIKCGRLCQKTDEFRKGIALAMASLGVDSVDGFAEDIRNYTTVPYEILYWGYFWIGKKELAKKYWKMCIEMEPDNDKYVNDGKFFSSISDSTPDISVIKI